LRKHWREEDVRWELDPLLTCAHFLVERDPYRGGTLKSELGRFLTELARYREAEPLLVHALALAEAEHGRTHPAVAGALCDLAGLLQFRNRTVEAEAMYRRALVMLEQHFGKDHTEAAGCPYSLADLLRLTYRLTEAEPMDRRALAVFEQRLNTAHPDIVDHREIVPVLRAIALSLTGLGNLLPSTSRLVEAEPLLRRALAIEDQHFDPEDSFISGTLNDLAGILYNTNRFAEAESFLRRALAITEKNYGPNHPEVAISLNNLAALLQATNRMTEAEPLLRRQLVILLNFTRVTGQPHQHLRVAVNKYHSQLEAMGHGRDEIVAILDKLAPDFHFR